MLTSVKITKKGQITIPKKIREILKSDLIEFEVIDERIVLKPVRSVAGSLQSYAKKVISYQEARGKAWDEVVKDRYGRKTRRH